jgi:hypothetical protein
MLCENLQAVKKYSINFTASLALQRFDVESALIRLNNIVELGAHSVTATVSTCDAFLSFSFC